MQLSNFITICLACFSCQFFATWFAKIHNCNRIFTETGKPARSMPLLIVSHVAGACCLGLLPWLFVYGSHIPTETPDFPRFIALTMVIGLIGLFGGYAGSLVKLKESLTLFARHLMCEYFIARVIFLSSYEYFFRGILLFETRLLMGTLYAIIVSTTLTVLLHVFTNKKEMLACIPFGLLQCILCIYLQSVWPAMLVHVALSMAYELPAIKHLTNKLNLAK
jgi:membrane protease YdiL (CAAX protease family)